jgi:hypothetical protein
VLIGYKNLSILKCDMSYVMGNDDIISLRIFPITGPNLNPWPEKPAPMIILEYCGWRSIIGSESGVMVYMHVSIDDGWLWMIFLKYRHKLVDITSLVRLVVRSRWGGGASGSIATPSWVHAYITITISVVVMRGTLITLSYSNIGLP